MQKRKDKANVSAQKLCPRSFQWTVMLFILLVSGFATLSFAQSDLRCQHNWTQFGTRCFRINTTESSWNDAEQNCVIMKSHLASLHNKEEYAFLQGLVLRTAGSNAQTWLGATNIIENAVWVWTDGTPFDYYNWSGGQPDDFLGGEHCLQMNFPVLWNDVVCSNRLLQACVKAAVHARIVSVIQLNINSTSNTAESDMEEYVYNVKQKLDSTMPSNSTISLKRMHKKPAHTEFSVMTSAILFILIISGLSTLSSAQSGLRCHSTWAQYGSRCFIVFTALLSWDDAEQNCVNNGGHLASVHSTAEYSFIQDLVLKTTLANTLAWLGANDVAQPSVWVWSDGSNFDFPIWYPGQPDNLMVENCVQMNFGGEWNSAPCSYPYVSVCAKSAIPATVSAVIQLKIQSDNELLQSDAENLVQKVKQSLIKSGMPSTYTLRLTRFYEKSYKGLQNV